MKELVNKLKGDRVIWSFVALLALFSFMPVFSASSNLAYIGHGTGNTLGGNARCLNSCTAMKLAHGCSDGRTPPAQQTQSGSPFSC